MSFNSTHYAMAYPQNGDSIVAIDSVTSLYPVYICVRSKNGAFATFTLI